MSRHKRQEVMAAIVARELYGPTRIEAQKYLARLSMPHSRVQHDEAAFESGPDESAITSSFSTKAATETRLHMRRLPRTFSDLFLAEERRTVLAVSEKWLADHMRQQRTPTDRLAGVLLLCPD
jgi:hypothetical protein